MISSRQQYCFGGNWTVSQCMDWFYRKLFARLCHFVFCCSYFCLLVSYFIGLKQGLFFWLGKTGYQEKLSPKMLSSITELRLFRQRLKIIYLWIYLSDGVERLSWSLITTSSIKIISWRNRCECGYFNWIIVFIYRVFSVNRMWSRLTSRVSFITTESGCRKLSLKLPARSIWMSFYFSVI